MIFALILPYVKSLPFVRTSMEKQKGGLTVPHVAPFLRVGRGERFHFLPVVFLLCCVVVLACVLYGPRVLLLTLCSVTSAIVCEFLLQMILTGHHTALDGSAAITGLCVVCLCPASVPYWLPALGSAFGILVAKQAFGGLGKNIVNPAAAGWCLMRICFPAQMTVYPAADLSYLSLSNLPAFEPVASMTDLLHQGTFGGYRLSDFLFCRLPGPIGTSSVLLLIACAIFLLIRGTARADLLFCYLVGASLPALLFSRGGLAPISLVFELCSGSLLFCSVFLLADPVTAPKTLPARAIYGFAAGSMTLLLRCLSPWTETAPLAIFAVNLLARPLDSLAIQLKFRNQIKNHKTH